MWAPAFTLFLDRKRFERGFHVERFFQRGRGWSVSRVARTPDLI